MAEDEYIRRDLLVRIAARRAGVQAFIRENRPRARRLMSLTIVLTSLAAAFTAGPAIGGETFASSVQDSLHLASDSYVWRTLCLLALLVSVGAAVLTNLAKSQDTANRLNLAEAANAELEGLSTLLQYGDLPVQEGVKLYQQYIGKISFVEDAPPTVQALPPGYAPPPYAGPGQERSGQG